jgi:hypothetical protein
MAFVSFLNSIGNISQTTNTFSVSNGNGVSNIPNQSVFAAGSMLGGPGSVRIPVTYLGAPNSLTLLQKSKPKAYCF